MSARPLVQLTPKEAASVIADARLERVSLDTRWRRLQWRIAGYGRAFAFAVARRHPGAFARGYATGREDAWKAAKAVAFALGQEIAGREVARRLPVQPDAAAGVE